MDLGEPPVFPSLRLPEPVVLPRPILEVPRADIPSYKPLVVPPSDLRPPPGVEGEAKDEAPKPEPTLPEIKPPEINYVDVPFLDQEIPLPTPEILATAGTTAVVSVAATLTATSVFKWCVTAMKPVLKQLWTRITKKASSSDSSSSSGPQDS